MDLEAVWAAGLSDEGLACCLERLGSAGVYARYALEFALELGNPAALVRLEHLENGDPEFLALKSQLLWQRGRLEEALEAAQRAYQQQPSFLTAFALANATGLRSPREAEGWFKESLRLAEGSGLPHRAVQAAAGLATLQITLGKYSQAETWAAWALRLAEHSGLQHPGVRNTLLAAQGYAQILGAQLTSLPPLNLTQPEAALAQGDFLLALGQAEAALEVYTTLDQSLYPIRARRLPILARRVRALLELGRLEEAQRLGQEARTLSEGTLEVFRDWGELAYLLPRSLSHPVDVLEPLARLLRRFLQWPNAPRAAMAALYLARAQWALGLEHQARATLLQARPVLEGLSPGGRAFLAGPAQQFAEVWALWQPVPTLRLRFLGAAAAWLEAKPLRLSPRHQEILTALAAHPEGLSAEQLAIWVWGEQGQPEMARAEVNRLRKKVPLLARPYRFSGEVWADFLLLRQRLAQGDLEGALALYGGPLLPGSEAPGVVELREELWSLLKAALQVQGQPEQFFELALQEDDPELWEMALAGLPATDPRRALLEARLRRFWASD